MNRRLRKEWPLIRYAGSAAETSIGSKPIGSELGARCYSGAGNCQGRLAPTLRLSPGPELGRGTCPSRKLLFGKTFLRSPRQALGALCLITETQPSMNRDERRLNFRSPARFAACGLQKALDTIDRPINDGSQTSR
jgi:hypothetical protein